MRRVNWILVFILLVGAVLRFYGFPHIPFSYDEVSAWGRTGYKNFFELINRGVRGDGHPALIQVFLNYWRFIAGDSEAAFKLPFLLMGMGCIWLVFLIGKKWFNETVGIICASFIAVLQYTVIFSQVARPYMSGMFFSLAMVYYWSQYVFAEGGDRKRKSLVGFVFFVVLCCYNHYFSLLFAGIVCLSGVFFLPRKNLIEYSLAAIAVAVLFLPHIGISRAQFSIGGVGGWLAKPDSLFFGDYLSYIFDFSWIVSGVAIAIAILGVVFTSKNWMQKNKLRVLCLVWFIAPILIGYYYSIYRNPVLQYSVLIFSFPFLLMFMFSFYRDLKVWQMGVIATVILTTGIYGLVYQRKHYQIFYKQPIEQMVKASVKFVNDHPGKKTVIIIQEPAKYMGYYLKKWNSELKIYSWEDLNFQSYMDSRKFLTAQNADYVLCGNVPYDHVLVVKDLYPKLITTEKGFTYEFFGYARSNSPEKEVDDLSFSDTLNIKQPGKFWRVEPGLIRMDSSSQQGYVHFDSPNEYGCSYEVPLDKIMRRRDDILLVDVVVSGVSKGAGASLAVAFDLYENNVFWQEKPFTYFMDNDESSGHLIYALRFRDYNFTLENPVLKIYLWNKDHRSFNVNSMKVEIQNGNPLIYSLIEPLH